MTPKHRHKSFFQQGASARDTDNTRGDDVDFADRGL